MKIIADSGSTKTHWRVIDSAGKAYDYFSQGLNPYFISKDDYVSTLQNTFSKELNPEKVEKLYFYGSGCARSERAAEVKERLNTVFTCADIEVHSDILGAARALFQKSEGLVIILGSGTNVGFYNGQTVEHVTPSLGYIIGDEGSGAYLGKKLLRHWLYKSLPLDLNLKMNERYDLSISEILYKVYNQPFPNRFLAGFVPFLADHSQHPFVKEMVQNSFNKLVKRHLVMYDGFTTKKIGAIGSVAVMFEELLKDVINQHKGSLVNVIQYPIDSLTHFHSVK